ncbi:Acyl-coenzyme A dehydrogenase [Gammaproteobacteria bacterium]
MNLFFFVLMGAVMFLVLAYHQVSYWGWTLALAGLIFGWMAVADPGNTLTTPLLWGAFLLLVAPWNVPRVRKTLLTTPLLHFFRGLLPKISDTEREAIEAGTVWWDRELFSGRPDWRLLDAIPRPTLSQEEQAFLDGPVEKFCSMVDDWKVTHEDLDLPPEAWQFLKDQGFFGMIIPKEYGGLDFSALAHSAVVMKIFSQSMTAGMFVIMPNSISPARLILNDGTQAQKDYFLPRLARGLEVSCFAFTEPETGNDLAAVQAMGVVCHGIHQGGEIIGIRLNWNKRYITLCPVASIMALAFKLYDPENLLGKGISLGITMALIPTETPGVVTGRHHMPLNMVIHNGPTQGHDVFIPLDWIIGGVDQVGHGWSMLMKCLAIGRSISSPAVSAAATQMAFRGTGAYARIRRQFKAPIGRFEGVQEALARIAGFTYQVDATRILTAQCIDMGENPTVLSAIAKCHLTERMRVVINHAMDIHGGAGINLGPRNFLGRLYQSLPINITVEGANILIRSLVIFSLGVARSHPWILKEIEATRETNPRKALLAFDHAIWGHASLALGNFARMVFFGLGGARLISVPGQHPLERHYYRQMARLSSVFAWLSDMTLVLFGHSLKRRERISARLGDVVSNLYIVTASLQYFAHNGRKTEEIPLLQWACEEALFQCQEAILGLTRHLPLPVIGRVLNRLIFPFGRVYNTPSDPLSKQVANLLLEPSALRDRLTQGIYIPDDIHHRMGRLEDALLKVVAAEPLERRLQDAIPRTEGPGHTLETWVEQGKARGVINEAEATLILSADRARRDVVQVDDFLPEVRKKKSS